RNADQKSLDAIAAESRDLAARGRARRLQPEEYRGGSFTVSNLGMLGVDEFAAIMNPPEGAILAVGAIRDTPVAVEGRIGTAPLMNMTLSCDHRIIDGATGARFLGRIKELLEDPDQLAG
ncbi:MAG: 2-oxo acid dehydrogenase subunit E2, partial [Myxococcota bacterium]